MTFTSTPITVKDGAGNDKSLIAYNDGTNSVFAHPLLDANGVIISPATAGNQASANTILGAIQTLLSGILSVAANIAQIGGAALTLGQKAMSSSIPVVIASDQGAVPTSQAANTSGGTSTFSANGASGGNPLLTNTPVAVKASAGNLYSLDFVNTNTSPVYVQIFDAAAGSVIPGTTVPKLSKWVPASGSWEEKFSGEGKISFANAITMAATTGPANGTGPTAGVLANVTFK